MNVLTIVMVFLKATKPRPPGTGWGHWGDRRYGCARCARRRTKSEKSSESTTTTTTNSNAPDSGSSTTTQKVHDRREQQLAIVIRQGWTHEILQLGKNMEDLVWRTY